MNILKIYCFLKEKNQWSLIEIFGYKPPARLDFAYCKVSYLQNKKEPHSSSQLSLEGSDVQNNKDPQLNDSNESSTTEKNVNSIRKEDVSNFLLVHGGMDTEGNVFDDLFFINLE